MTVLIIIVLIITNIITAAMAVSMWQAWRDGLDAIDAAYDFGVIDTISEDSPGILRDGAPVTQEYGKTGDVEGRGATPATSELDELFQALRGNTDAD